MDNNLLINEIKEYTLLSSNKKSIAINELIALKDKIILKVNNINNINEKYSTYHSIADAILESCIYIDDFIYYENDLLDKFILIEEIELIKCTNFNKIYYSHIINSSILCQFILRKGIDSETLNLYIKHFLSIFNYTIEEQVENLRLITNKFNTELKDFNVDGSFLANVLINTPRNNKNYNELKQYMSLFKNKNTIKSFNKTIDNYKLNNINF